MRRAVAGVWSATLNGRESHVEIVERFVPHVESQLSDLVKKLKLETGDPWIVKTRETHGHRRVRALLVFRNKETWYQYSDGWKEAS